MDAFEIGCCRCSVVVVTAGWHRLVLVLVMLAMLAVLLVLLLLLLSVEEHEPSSGLGARDARVPMRTSGPQWQCLLLFAAPTATGSHGLSVGPQPQTQPQPVGRSVSCAQFQPGACLLLAPLATRHHDTPRRGFKYKAHTLAYWLAWKTGRYFSL